MKPRNEFRLDFSFLQACLNGTFDFSRCVVTGLVRGISAQSGDSQCGCSGAILASKFRL